MNHAPEDQTLMTEEMASQQLAAYDLEIARLEEQERLIAERKKAFRTLRAAIAPLAGDGQKRTSGGANKPQHVTGSGALSATMATVNGAAHHHPASTGFSASVREVLRQHPRGLHPREVVAELQRVGAAAKYTGKSSLSVRVGNELFRLLKAGTLQRRSGRYIAPQALVSPLVEVSR